MMRRVAIPVLVTGLLGSAVVISGASVALAADDDIVISELMYHPASDDSDEEFIELTNRGASPVDVSDWCFDGIDFCFPNPTVIAAGGIVVLAPDAATFTATYGIVADGEYSASLSNGGEDISLLDETEAVIDLVDYDDAPPWPVTPDGGGPSMELIALGGDNNDAWNWAASVAPAGHTAGAPNSVALSANPPSIDDVSANPARPNPNQSVTVTATVRNTTGVSLDYRIGFGGVSTVAMSPTGGDVYEATIPGQSAGELIRYRIEASGARDASLPRVDDSIEFHGVTVADPTLSADLPVLEWFMPQAEYVDMVTNHRYDDQLFDAVFAYDGVVYDGVKVRVRGDSSRDEAKSSLNVELPDGHLFDLPGLISGPVDRFALNALAQSLRDPITLPSAWTFQTAAGELDRDYASLHVQRNGSFQGMYGYIELLDDKWRERHDMDDWTIYKPDRPWGSRPINVAWDKKSPDDGDYSDLQEMLDGIDDPTTDWLFDNFDIPGMVNFAALETLLRNEPGSAKNFYMVRDGEDTGRWRGLLWDVNNTFKCSCDLVPPLNNDILATLVDDARFRDMLDRRLRTLLDEFLYSGQWEAWFNEYHDQVASTRLLDNAIWGNGTAAQARTQLVNRLNNKFEPFYVNAPPIPPSASGATPVVINEIHNDPLAGGDAEFLELRNLSETESIDLSGWTVSEAFDFTFPAGTVLLADDTLVIVDTDTEFRANSGSGHFVAGQWSGGLSSGETIELRRADGTLVDTVTYGEPGWPEATNGQSLELINPEGDHNSPSSWTLSLAPGGTPDAPNQDPPAVDTFDPTTSLTAPAHGSTVASNTVAIAGSAADNVDLDRVEVTVEDTGSGLWLQSNGSFGAAPANLVASLSNDVGTSADWSLSVTLPDGDYTASATAFDASSNSDATAAVSSFTVAVPLPDTVDPTTVLTGPVNGSTVVSNSVSIAGSAADDVDLDRVEVSVQDTGSGLWLQSNGSFGAAPADLVASLSNDVGTSADWELSVTLPDGAYTASATAFDSSANSDGSPAVTSFTVDTFVPDTTDPTTVLAAPVNGSTLTSGAVAITGSAADNVEVDRVEVSVQDTGSGLWLQSNGSFGAAPANLVATLSNDVGTSADWELSATLPDGDYTALATAFDASANSDGSAATSSFTVAVPPPDTTDPTTSVTSPVNGSTLTSGSVAITGSAADNVEVDRVEVTVQDTGTGLWLQSNGSFGAAPANLVASLSNDVGTSADWSLSATLPDGDYTVSATAFDASANSDGTAAVSSFTVSVPVPVASVEFRAAASAYANRPAVPVTVPGAVEAGDVLVLFVQGNRNNASVTAPPSGWTLLDTLQDGTTESWVYTRIAPPGYAGSTVQVGFSVRMKTSVTLVAYSGASGVSAIGGLGEPGSSSSHDAPSVAVDTSGSVVVTHWGDKTSGHSGWTMPSELTEIASTSGSGGGQVNTSTAETAPVDAGVWPGATATSGSSGSKMIAWSVVIAPE